VSRKSNKADSFGNPSAIANAMYDAQKKEITNSMAISVAFIFVGAVVAVIGAVQYFQIESHITDSSEKIDAMAWVVIAGVGLLVGIIGLVSMMKSLVSLGQIGSWAKEAESHASPFQAQKLHRKVAAMNQSQSMEKPEMKGAAEQGAPQKSKFGLFKRGRDNKEKQSNEDLYYKYNPQEKPQMAKPEKAAPMMEQKFDYGINEAKKLTFADEFLKKNKRDPFAQYRKDLGIEEEPEMEFIQKPKFITHGTANNDSNDANNTVQQPMSTVPLNLKSNNFADNIPKTDNQGELTFSTSTPETQSKQEAFTFSLSTPSDSQDKTNTTENSVIDFEHDQINQSTDKQATPIQFEDVAINSSTYGTHNHEDDDMFFSAKPVTPPTQQITQQNFKPNLAAALDKAAPTAPAPPTVVLDLDYKKENSSEDYDFSLFEEIDPVKANKAKIEQKRQEAETTQKTSNDDMFFGGSSTPNESQKAAPAKQIQQQPVVQQQSGFKGQSTQQQRTRTQQQPQMQQQPVQQMRQPQMQQQPVQQMQPQMQQQPVQQQKGGKKTSTPPKSRNTKSNKKKKSFSDKFLSNNGKIENSDSEIVKNGTRSQRKFVDASEYDEWSCPQCGKVNQEYVGICACGARKPRAK